jgi:type IV secretory pathway TraG/TraD family ATPase VirD4
MIVSYHFVITRTYGYAARQLMTPSEVMQMHNEEQVIFMRNLRPTRCNIVPYYTNTELTERSTIKPPKEIDFE